MYDGKPIAASERMERLSMEMAKYPADQQKLMWVWAVEVLD
jgi:hypothetical protein